MAHRAIIYYITGHGFGHARRSAEVVRTLLASRDDLHVHVRTAAAPHLFRDLGPRGHFEPVVIDRGCIEIDPLRLDWAATLRQVRQLLDQRDAIVEREVAYVREHNVGLIAADIPFLAGEVANAAGVPCWGACNFTWDWIYEPYVTAEHGDLLRQVTRGYERMAGIMRYPFAHEMPHFAQQIDVPLMAVPARFSHEQATELLQASCASQRGIDLHRDRRPRVLVAMRGGISTEAIERAAAQSPEMLFFSWAHGTPVKAANLLDVPGQTPLQFHDVLQTCDAVVTKLGHGIVTDCITGGVALLWPPRSGFREDAMVMEMSRPYLRQRSIDVEAFEAGDWRQSLQSLLGQPKPTQTLPADGIQTVATHLITFLAAFDNQT